MLENHIVFFKQNKVFRSFLKNLYAEAKTNTDLQGLEQPDSVSPRAPRPQTAKPPNPKPQIPKARAPNPKALNPKPSTLNSQPRSRPTIRTPPPLFGFEAQWFSAAISARGGGPDLPVPRLIIIVIVVIIIIVIIFIVIILIYYCYYYEYYYCYCYYCALLARLVVFYCH